MDEVVRAARERGAIVWASRSPTSRFRGVDRRSFMPWMISIGVHGVLVVVAFFTVFRRAEPVEARRPEIIVSFDNPGPAALGSEQKLAPPMQRPPPPPVSPTAVGADATPAMLAAHDLLEQHERRRAWDPEPRAVVTTDAPPVEAQRPRADPTAAPIGDAVVFERRLPEVRFAGVGASNAQDIVYVVDASGSMIGTFPYVLEHLRRSVTRLARTQRFQVIFFGPDEFISAPHPGDIQEGLRHTRLIRATPENIASVLGWMKSIIPTGRSNPTRALQAALSLHEREHLMAVFVLSNTITGLGQWEADKAALLAEIDALNPINPRTGQRPAVIKAVQFLEEDPEGVLKSIAEAHGGMDGYKFISRQDVLGKN